MYLNFENPYQMDSNDVKMNNRGNCYLKLSKWTVRVILPRYVSKISCYVSLHNRTRDLLKCIHIQSNYVGLIAVLAIYVSRSCDFSPLTK